MTSLFETFLNSPRDSFQRVDGIHPADLYIGKDDISRWTLLLVSNNFPHNLVSSRMISVIVGKRNDGKSAVSFSLIDESYGELFVLFCKDIIESSRIMKTKNKSASFIIRRYLEWKEMLANSNNSLLSPEVVKGLLGEMYFLKNYLGDVYGIEKAASSWTGPQRLAQDFIIDNTWYEIKTINTNRNTVNISSIEQLDSETNGKLVIVYADRTSVTNEKALNLNILYDEILKSFSNEDAKAKFSNMLFRFGYYPRAEYESEEYTFEVKLIRQYAVTPEFPCIRRRLIPTSIDSAEYKVIINMLNDFLVV